MKKRALILFFILFWPCTLAARQTQDIFVTVNDKSDVPLDSISVALVNRIREDTLQIKFTDSTGFVEFRNVLITSGESGSDIPDEIFLSPGYPNPFQNRVSMSLKLSENSKIKADVYNILGQKVLNIEEQRLISGSHTLNLQLGGLVDGVYFVRLFKDGHVFTKQVTKMGGGSSGILQGNWNPGGTAVSLNRKIISSSNQTDFEIYVFDPDSLFYSDVQSVESGVNNYVFRLETVPQKQDSSLPPPNIILIMADDLGYETIGAYGGSSYATPEIDRMAENGMRFNHAYAQPLCTPSRVELMTGIYNIRNYISFQILDESQTTFSHLFKNAGYSTAIIGKWQLGKNPESPKNAGFDYHALWQVEKSRADSTGRDTRYSKPVLQIDGNLIAYDKTDYGPDIINEYGLDFIQNSYNENKPFLLYYPMILTHSPFSPTPDSPEWLEDTTAVMSYEGNPDYFEDMVTYMDKMIGKINLKLDELGIQDNTIVIFTGDNGTGTPIVSIINGNEITGGKGKTTDAGTRVPLIVTWPDFIRPNSIDTSLIDFSDFFPTILEAAKIDIPDSLDIDGQSFLPQLLGIGENSRNWMYSWFSKSGSESEAQIFARNQRYKLYDSGEFYNIPEDYLELNPLNIDELNENEKDIYQLLNEVLIKYKDRRLDAVHSNFYSYYPPD